MATFYAIKLFILFCRFATAFNILRVQILDALTRATLKALTARDTLAVINDRNIVYKYDCLCGAVALTLSACDTTCLTFVHYVLAATLS